MYSKAILLSILAALAEARFGQEQIPIPAIAAVTSGGEPGVAATLAGAAISTLLGAANPCAKLVAADEIIAKLGTGADAVLAAQGLVAAEQNFNPFAAQIPTFCSDPTLPTTEILRGIVPLIDPAVVGAEIQNALSAQSLQQPFDAAGLSVAEVAAANGFTNFSTKDLAGNAGAAPAGGAAGGAEDEEVVENNGGADNVTVTATPTAAPTEACPSTLVTVTVKATQAAATPTETPAVEAPAQEENEDAADNGDVEKSSIDGLDFGLCVPTIKREAGVNGRKATEFTFLPVDPLVAEGQSEALNPNIITNRICDQLVNVCEANEAAKAACATAETTVAAAGTRDDTTVELWNTLLGF